LRRIYTAGFLRQNPTKSIGREEGLEKLLSYTEEKAIHIML
jgi:hypothetical protein